VQGVANQKKEKKKHIMKKWFANNFAMTNKSIASQLHHKLLNASKLKDGFSNTHLKRIASFG